MSIVKYTIEGETAILSLENIYASHYISGKKKGCIIDIK